MDYHILSNGIRELAITAKLSLLSHQQAYKIAKFRSYRPVDYHRYAEFKGVIKSLHLSPGLKVLDIGSPQWFVLFLAKNHPDIEFHYSNILFPETGPYEKIAKAIGLKNLHYHISDVKHLPFKENWFDKVISISVIEHIFPAEGGDDMALQEISRVLKATNDCIITIPFKDKAGLMYINGPVFERKSRGRNFFARLYDEESFSNLMERNSFSIKSTLYTCEKFGLFSPDYFEWGPGKKIPLVAKLIDSRKFIERILNFSCEEQLANRYLVVSTSMLHRTVDIIATIRPKT
jgi:ubiquinone/menaquinone biosynthesis C-methylase UbiE